MFQFFATILHNSNEPQESLKEKKKNIVLKDSETNSSSSVIATEECFTYVYPLKSNQHLNLQDYFDGKMDTVIKSKTQRTPGVPVKISCSLFSSEQSILNYLSSLNTSPHSDTYVLRLGFDIATVEKLILQGNFHLAICEAYLFSDLYNKSIGETSSSITKIINENFSAQQSGINIKPMKP